MKIRFGIGLGADTGPEQLAGIVDHLEASGVDSLWFSELVYSKAVDPFVGMAYALARTTNLKVGTRGASSALRLIERFARTAQNHIDYRVTFVDPATWTAPWTAALDLAARPDDAGVFEYACHEGNYGMANMLATSRLLERTGVEPAR